MPIYEYACTSGHVTDHVHRFSDGERPAAIDCPTPGCGLSAVYRVAPPAATMGCKRPEVEAEPVEERDEDMGLTNHDFKCTSSACGHAFEDLNDWSAGQRPRHGRECPKCGEPAALVPSLRFAEWTVKTYGAQGGYYDRGLGCFVKSPAHRAAICKERGLIPVDGDWDADAMLRKIHERDDAHDKAYAEYADKIDNAPEFASLRAAQDAGQL